MQSTKGKIGLLTVLFLLFTLCGLTFVYSPTIASVGADIRIVDDFTLVSNIEDKNDLDMSNVYDYSGVSRATAFVDAGFGLIPAEMYSAMPRTGDGYVVYKIQADEGYFLKDATLDLSAYVSHCDAAQYIGKEKTNIKAFVATNSSSYTEVYSFCPTGGGGEYVKYSGTGSVRLENTKKSTVDISSLVVGAKTVFVKIELYHLTYQEIIDSGISSINSFVDVENGLVKRVGVSLHKVEIKATQTVEGAITTKVGFSESYVSGGINIANSDNVESISNLMNFPTPDWHGVLPITEWKAYCPTVSGSVVYKIQAKSGSTLKNAKVTLGLGLSTAGGLYNWWSGNMDNANVYVDVSTDGQNFNKIYDVLNDQSLYVTDVEKQEPVNPFKASMFVDGVYDSSLVNDCFNNVTATVNLTGYSGQVFYIRVRIKHPTPLDVHSSYTSGVPMNRLAIQYHSFSVIADQESLPVEVVKTDDTGKFFIEDSFRNIRESFATWKTGVEVSGLSTYLYGHNDFGLVPSSGWGDPVNAANGYVIYQIPLNGNGITASLKKLSLDLEYKLNGQHNTGDLTVSTSLDGASYSEIFRATNVDELPSQSTSFNKTVDLTDVVVDESALSAKILYVKITLEHQEKTSYLGHLAVNLFSVKFTGQQNIVMDKGASVRISEIGNGIKFTTMISKSAYQNLLDAGYTLSFGTFIMPKDYIATYGAGIDYQSIFGENSKYCFGQAVIGKTLIMHKSALLNTEYHQDYHAFSYSIVNLAEENYDRQFIARGYVKCEKGGETKYIFADYAQNDIENNSRSMAYVAQMAFDYSDDLTEKYKLRVQYLNKVKNDTVNYTVTHVYFSGNDIAEVKTTTATAKVGNVVCATTSSKTGYEAVESITVYSGSYVSTISGTALADGRLQLVIYYKKTA